MIVKLRLDKLIQQPVTSSNWQVYSLWYALFPLQVFMQHLPPPRTSVDKSVAHISVVNQYFDGTLNCMHSLTFATKNSSNDTFILKEMLKQEDVGSFVEAMTKEVQAH